MADTPPVAAKYHVGAVDALTQRDTILALWRDTLGAPDTQAAKFQWYYVDHPLGPPAVILLRHGPAETPVGVAANGARAMWLDGQAVHAGIRVDLAVDAAHRTLFPALQLQRAIRQQGLDRFDLLYGLPNRKAEKIVERIGFGQRHDFVRYVCVLRWRDYLGRVMPLPLARLLAPLLDGLQQAWTRLRGAGPRGTQVSWLSRADERFDALWRRVSAPGALPGLLLGERSARFLNWRFVARPGSGSRILALTDTASGALLAYAVCEIDGSAATVVDFLVDPQGRGGRDEGMRLLPRWLRRVQREVRRLGCSSLSLHFLGCAEVRAALAVAGFRPRDSHPLFVDIPPRSADRLAGFDYYFTAADEDQ